MSLRMILKQEIYPKNSLNFANIYHLRNWAIKTSKIHMGKFWLIRYLRKIELVILLSFGGLIFWSLWSQSSCLLGGVLIILLREVLEYLVSSQQSKRPIIKSKKQLYKRYLLKINNDLSNFQFLLMIELVILFGIF